MLSILNIYGLYELITEPRGVTPVSKTLIGLCITHSPEKVTNSRASFNLILVIMLLDSLIDRNGPRKIEMRMFVFLPKWHFGKMFLTSRVLLLCKSQHFTGTLLVIMIAKNLYPSC